MQIRQLQYKIIFGYVLTTFEQLELIVQDIFDYMNSAISLHSHTQ